jgi:hypothetical protein
MGLVQLSKRCGVSPLTWAPKQIGLSAIDVESPLIAEVVEQLADGIAVPVIWQ